ncbi:exosortase-dependent surface protein XDP2 [Mastigocoleus testarum]|uniref:PEP-CTERM domain protein n=1 Tax=Mastigocoleus testarum BC008 TaxID=371196 RepID=A0A0V7ZFH8_9CYAN|nr:exosortase-dependent surface protein XDP2 [Mastigocoleus testarum]KST63267.1 PEP-CTERM domain protein [Mastigocoleus testarum BC008]
MKIKSTLTSLSLILGTLLAVSNSAHAASFKTNVSQTSDPTADILLKSIEQNGQTISEFSFVTKTDILFNTPRNSDPNSGEASTDRGDNANNPGAIGVNEDPNGAEINAYLGNNNLNNIVDGEGNGEFKINLFFDSLIQKDNSGLDSLFFWERGKNSDLGVRAIDSAGNVIGNEIKLLRKNQFDADYSINTTEIGGSQKVGSWGVSLDQLGVESLSGVQVFADKTFSGPDFKLAARKTSVPEPGSVLGLGAVVGMAFWRRRHKKTSSF